MNEPRRNLAENQRATAPVDPAGAPLAARPVAWAGAASPALVEADAPDLDDEGHGAVTEAFIATGRSMSSAFRAVGRSFQRVF